MTAKNYRDLIVWQKAFELALAIYAETACFSAEEKYGISSQLRKAGVSIPSNIAEGEGRHSRNEFRHFLSIAHGSLREAETQVLLTEALGYMKKDQSSRIMSLASEVERLINGLSRSLRSG
jgi:four helix bundle protein